MVIFKLTISDFVIAVKNQMDRRKKYEANAKMIIFEQNIRKHIQSCDLAELLKLIKTFTFDENKFFMKKYYGHIWETLDNKTPQEIKDFITKFDEHYENIYRMNQEILGELYRSGNCHDCIWYSTEDGYRYAKLTLIQRDCYEWDAPQKYFPKSKELKDFDSKILDIVEMQNDAATLLTFMIDKLSQEISIEFKESILCFFQGEHVIFDALDSDISIKKEELSRYTRMLSQIHCDASFEDNRSAEDYIDRIILNKNKNLHPIKDYGLPRSVIEECQSINALDRPKVWEKLCLAKDLWGNLRSCPSPRSTSLK